MRLILLTLAFALALPLAAQSPAAAEWSGQFDYSTFGSVNVGSIASQTFTLTNNTAAEVDYNLFLQTFASDNPGEPECPFYIVAPTFDNTNQLLVVPANGSVSVTVEWRPTVKGYEDASLVAVDPQGNWYPALLSGTAQ